MALQYRLLFLVVCVVYLSATYAQDPPVFKESYVVNCVLKLPYAEIVEPFTVHYDAKNKRSKIEYYDGLVTTFLRGDLGKSGVSYKVAFMSTDTKLNTKTCFQTNGTKDAPITAQNIFPDLTGFKKITTTISGVDVWQNVTVEGKKKNTYTFYIDQKTKKPQRYVMMGYDSLLGSHYDKYIIEYSNYEKSETDPSQFNPPKELTCAGFPGPGAEEQIMMNPMHEFVHHYTKHVDEAFDQYKVKHGKDYKDGKEHEMRKHHFRNNFRFIHSKNRATRFYNLRVNRLADRAPAEIKLMLGRKYSKGYNGGLPFNKYEYNLQDVPDQMDWRLYGAVTPVKDQAVCGSCWSFGTTGTIEGAHFLKTRKLVRLSQQALMDCSWGEGNNACDGGEDFRAYQWIMKKGGIPTAQSYGDYLAVDGKCHSMNATIGATMKGYVNVTAGDGEALKIALAKNGPISVSIDASHRSFVFYADGVYYEPKCGNKPDQLDHSVLAVGYGVLYGQPYWLIKNSWSTYWGNDGYVLMAQRDNNCGVATAPTFVVM